MRKIILLISVILHFYTDCQILNDSFFEKGIIKKEQPINQEKIYNEVLTKFYKFNESENVVDIDGNIYKTIKIDKQEWMIENLKVTKYNNGSKIANITLSDWDNLNQGAWCYYKNDSSHNSKYGKLYNWYVINNNNLNVCPIGWSVPTIQDWNYLFNSLKVENNIRGVQLTNSNFNVVLSGKRNIGNSLKEYDFYNLNIDINWWTSNEKSKSAATSINVVKNYSNIFFSTESKNAGLSIRCVKNHESEVIEKQSIRKF